MAVLNNKKSRVSDEIPTSSMADIAFLLLIFFLVTTVFPKDKGLSIVLPEPGEEAQVSQKNILHLHHPAQRHRDRQARREPRTSR